MASAPDDDEPPNIMFINDAIDDLRRIGPDAAVQAVKKLGHLLDDVMVGPPLGGDLTGYRKLVVGPKTWRIVYCVDDSNEIVICEIWAVGPRANDEVYREAAARVAKAASDDPSLVPLVDVVERLGLRARGLAAILESLGSRTRGTAPEVPAPEVVPAWLADRLINKVGLARIKVSTLTLDEAISLWEDFMGRPR